MTHTIRDQYNLIAGDEGLSSDFNAMLAWLEGWSVKPCNSVYFGEEINAIYVHSWIDFRNSLSNASGKYSRSFLEETAREECEAIDFYEIQDCMDEISDGQLMAIGRIFDMADSDEQERVPSDVNSRYADSIIAGNPSAYDAVEVHGVRNLNNSDDPDGTHYEVDDESPELYSVYLHCVGGGIECVGDFSTHEQALFYANELAAMYTWRVMDFAQPSINPKEELITKYLRGFDPMEFATLDWDLLGSIDQLENCRGEVVCIFTDSYTGLEEAAASGAVYFGSQPICNRSELEGALIGHEMTIKATGVSAQLFFVRTD